MLAGSRWMVGVKEGWTLPAEGDEGERVFVSKSVQERINKAWLPAA